MNIESVELEQLEVALRKSCGMILNFYPCTHNILLPQLMAKIILRKLYKKDSLIHLEEESSIKTISFQAFLRIQKYF